MTYRDFIRDIIYLSQVGMWDNDGEFLYWHRVAEVTPVFKITLRNIKWPLLEKVVA